MKRIESIKLEVGKVISELTQKYLNQGLVLTRFETGGINGFTKVMVFSSLNSSEQQVIFARESSVECYLKVQKVATHTVYTATMTEEEAGIGFIDSMFEGAEKEVVTEFVLMKHRGKQFLVTKEESVLNCEEFHEDNGSINELLSLIEGERYYEIKDDTLQDNYEGVISKAFGTI